MISIANTYCYALCFQCLFSNSETSIVCSVQETLSVAAASVILWMHDLKLACMTKAHAGRT